MLTTFTILKFVHVLAAIVWVGGAIFVQIYATSALRSADPAELGFFARRVAVLGQRVFMPASIVVLAVGVWMVAITPFDFTDLWIVIGIGGIVATALTGAILVGPEAGRVGKLLETEGPEVPGVQERIRRIFVISRVDLIVLVLVVFDMVIKPGS